MTHAILTTLGTLCLLLVICRRGALLRDAREAERQAIQDAQLAWIDRHVSERGRQIDVDDDLPVRVSGWIGKEDLR